MSELEPLSCSEFNALSRRQFLRGTVGAGVLAALAPAWLPEVAFAQDFTANRDVLVSLYLRGGTDGLSLCVPHGDPDYYAAGVRPTLAIARPDSTNANRALDLDGFFGLPPAMKALQEAYAAKHLLIVHAAGSTSASHSHFDAQHNMEVGKPEDINVQTGWLGRHLASVQPLQANNPLRALALGYALPATLAGADKAVALPDLTKSDITGNPKYAAQTRDWLRQAYAAAPDAVQQAAANTLNTLDVLRQINFKGYVPTPGVVYPDTRLGQSLKAAAALIKAQVGVEAIHTDHGIWDTHSQQNPINGAMAALMNEFAGAIAAFHADVFAGNTTNVTLVALSEFGRTVYENASRGTDHGHGNALFVLGAGIKGGRVQAKWPGLNREQLSQGADLQVTTDYRDILAEIVSRRLGNPNVGFVFPDYVPTFQNITA